MCFMDKVVLVTGAGSGIGEAIAINFAASSAKLSLLDNSPENLRKVVENCEKFEGAKVINIVTDVTKDDDLKRAVDLTLKEYRSLDIVVNCAGVSIAGLIEDANIMEIYDRTMNVNLRSIVAMTNYVIKPLIETKGCIVNISSIMSKLPYEGATIYNVSKAGVTHFTKCVALELAGKGVRVNCVSPGPVKTNIIINNGGSQEVSDKIFLAMKNQAPLQNLFGVEEVAELVAFLASDKAKCITGADFVIDTGFSLTGLPNVSQALLGEQVKKVIVKKN